MNQRATLMGVDASLKKEKKYWDERLSGISEKLTFRYDHKAAYIGEKRLANIDFKVDKNVFETLRSQFAGDSHLDISMIIMTALHIVVSKCTGSTDVVLQTQALQKNEPLSESVLFLRTEVKHDMSLRNLLIDVQNEINSANARRKFLSETFRDEPDNMYTSIAGICWIWDGMLMNRLFNFINLDVLVSAKILHDELVIHWTFDRNLYRKETIEALGRALLFALSDFTDNLEKKVSQTFLVGDLEKNRIVKEYGIGEPFHLADDNTVISLFEKKALEFKNKSCLVENGTERSFGAVNSRANAIAATLLGNGVRKNSLVAILLPPSTQLIETILGVLKAGAAYVIIDINLPTERKKYMIDDSNVSAIVFDRHVITNREVLSELNRQLVIDLSSVEFSPTNNPNISLSKNDLAYILYTSGSTGMPKGVMIEHGALLNYLTWAAKEYLREDDYEFALFTSPSFDLTITSLFLPLVTGKRLNVYNSNDMVLPVRQVVEQRTVNIIKLTPSHLSLLCDGEQNLEHLKCIIVGGEQLDLRLARKAIALSNGNAALYNEYGPTECTVGCIYYKVGEIYSLGHNVLIGKPAPNTRAYILDIHGGVLPIGIAGELHLAGNQLFRGYASKADQTALQLIDDNIIGEGKMYKTGDLARWLPDGNIEFLGRVDDQIKLSGYRIEPGEIESQVLSFPGITQAIVTFVTVGTDALVVYYVSQTRPRYQDIKEHLKEKLPEYMVPHYYVPLESMPLNANGKIDRKALPYPELDFKSDYIEPIGEIEKQLTMIWSQILGVKHEAIGVNANFFDLGGTSHMILRLVMIVQQQFDVDISVADVFRLANIKQMAAFIQGSNAETGRTDEQMEKMLDTRLAAIRNRKEIQG
jgi:bacitracin synthase 3